MSTLSTRLHSYLSRFHLGKVVVLGDLMVDHFIWGRVHRISPEAPVPVVDVTSESVMLGGAGNVFLNLASLGVRTELCGVIGQDAAGQTLLDLLRRQGGSGDGIVVEEKRATTQKTRVIAHQQQVVRFDREHRTPVAPKTMVKLGDVLDASLDGAQCLVVSDYAKGVVSREMMERVAAVSAKHRVEVLVDPKMPNMAWYRGAQIVTPNHLEAAQATGIEIVDDASLARAGRALLEQFDGSAVLITRGELGMSLFERNGPVTHIPTVAKQVFDVTGAGDTVIATFAAARSVGASLTDAATLANCAAGFVVGVVGTAAITPDALRRQIDEAVGESGA